METWSWVGLWSVHGGEWNLICLLTTFKNYILKISTETCPPKISVIMLLRIIHRSHKNSSKWTISLAESSSNENSDVSGNPERQGRNSGRKCAAKKAFSLHDSLLNIGFHSFETCCLCLLLNIMIRFCNTIARHVYHRIKWHFLHPLLFFRPQCISGRSSKRCVSHHGL